MRFKNRILHITLVTISIIGSVYGQAGDKGNLHFNVEYGLDLFSTANNWNFNPPSLTGGADISLGVQYNTHKKVGLSIEVSQIDYIVDSSNVDGYLNIKSIGLGLNYYIINKEKLSFIVGTNVGLYNLDYQRDLEDDNGNVDDVSLFATGYYQKLYINTVKYFGKKHQFGINLKLGVMNAPYRWKEFEVNDIKVDVLEGKPTTDIITSQIGAFGHIGLTYHLRMNKSNLPDKK